ncbi:MAG: hypothetical protein HYX78_09630 [Armatimonadetes bacterium]|nr:hypothetical protein [Armatimonadota bacterium]
MERELFTRNFMTGWLLVAGFLASWLPRQDVFSWTDAQDFIQGKGFDLGAIATLAVAILGTPILGYAVSALVIAYLYVRKGDPYLNVSRNKARDVVGKMLPELRRKQDEPESSNCGVFSYLINTLGPESLIEWGRRRHTARFVGYNWATATVMGLVLGATLSHWKSVQAGWSVLAFGALLIVAAWAERALRGEKSRKEKKRESEHYSLHSLCLVLALGAIYSLFMAGSSAYAWMFEAVLLTTSGIMLVLGLQSTREVEEVERLWAEDYLRWKLKESRGDTSETELPSEDKTPIVGDSRPPQDNPKQNAVQGEKGSPVWDISQERAFIENLLTTRFNFFLVFFSVIVAGAVNAKEQVHLQLVLGLGAFICLLLSSVLGRSQEKLDLILEDIFQDDSHPAAIINNRANREGSRRRLIGVWIPRLCVAVLLIAFVASIVGFLAVPRIPKTKLITGSNYRIEIQRQRGHGGLR